MNIPALVPEPRDPLAVALGNASLLGVGYLMLGRRLLAAATGLVTLTLVEVHVAVVRSVWSEIVVLLWWAVLIGHGFLLADGRAQDAVGRGQRLAALGVTVPVLLTVAVLRLDAGAIGRDVADARRSGQCSRATATLDRVWFAHRVVDATLTVRGEQTVEACRRLRWAGDRFGMAMGGDTEALAEGFATLTRVLTELPGHRRMVEVTCGDDLTAAEDWSQARAHYRHLLKRYPGDAHAGRAQAGINRATLAIELANVRSLLAGPASAFAPR